MVEGGLGEGGVDACVCGEAERDAGIFGRVGGGEETVVVADDHVFGVGFEHARVGSGLAENVAEHFEVDPEGVADAEAFGECGGVNVHDHVDECFDLRGFAGRADVVERFAHVVEEWLGGIKEGFFAADHEEEFAVTRLRYAGGHAGFEALGADFGGGCIELLVHGRCERGAVDKGAAFGGGEEVIRAEENGIHRLIVGHDGEDDVGMGGDLGQLAVGRRADFCRELGGDCFVNVEDRSYVVAFVLEAASHVGAHAAEADESDFFIFHVF